MTPEPAAPPAAPAPAAPAPAAPAPPTPPPAAAAPPTPPPAAPTPPPPPARVVPEKYELTMPKDSPLDDGDRVFVEEVAKKSGWTNDEAQAALEEHHAAVQAQKDRFLSMATADPDYGGQRLSESQRLAKKAIDLLRPEGHTRREAFNTFLNRHGAGNHPEVLAFLADLGKMIGEDGAVTGRPPGGQPRSPEDVLYNKPTT